MTEVAFLKKRRDAWTRYEKDLASPKTASPDTLAELFIELTEDLSYARTFFPKSKTTQYLNQLAAKTRELIYRTRKEKSSRFVTFWTTELPLVFYDSRREFLYSFVFFSLAVLLGVMSSAGDDTFVRIILGDHYVNMTLENIKKGDPMAVYKKMNPTDMFLGITLNNVYVSFLAFVLGVFFSFGTVYMLFQNGVMLGSFQYFFYKQHVLWESVRTIWIHGTLEISAIILAGGAGLIIGNSFLFPDTFSRSQSFLSGAKRGLKIAIGLVPFFIVAAFFEGFVTRHTEMPDALALIIIGGSLGFVIWYVILYPRWLRRKIDDLQMNGAA
jgi:uncharacterized membrane protein SpoIIM required for sporulation